MYGWSYFSPSSWLFTQINTIKRVCEQTRRPRQQQHCFEAFIGKQIFYPSNVRMDTSFNSCYFQVYICIHTYIHVFFCFLFFYFDHPNFVVDLGGTSGWGLYPDSKRARFSSLPYSLFFLSITLIPSPCLMRCSLVQRDYMSGWCCHWLHWCGGSGSVFFFPLLLLLLLLSSPPTTSTALTGR